MAKRTLKAGLHLCPTDLPPEITAAAEALAAAYCDSSIRPQLSVAVLEHWDALIAEWADTPELPLFIRKQSADIGAILPHGETSRGLAPCDNSPAHWAIVTAFSQGTAIKLADIHSALKRHDIPVTMAMSNAEINDASMKGVLSKNYAVNAGEYGWKVDHIFDVGIKQRRRIQEIPINDLKEHFKRLMKPSNIVLVPSSLKGLGDMPAFIELVKKRSS